MAASGQDLYLEMRDKFRVLEASGEELGKRGEAAAKAERDYRVALAKKMLAERDGGMPVTILGDVCRGDEAIALLKLARDTADALYKSLIENINIYKLHIKIIENQIQREWGISKR